MDRDELGRGIPQRLHAGLEVFAGVDLRASLVFPRIKAPDRAEHLIDLQSNHRRIMSGDPSPK